MATLPGAVSEMTDEQMDESLGGVDESASPLRASILNSQNANRELAGRASVVGREMGVPADMAERNIEALERERSLEAFDFDALEQNHPILSDYLSDANNAKLFSDEVGFWTKTGDYLGSFAGQGVGRTVGSGLSGTGYYAQQADRKLAEFTGATGLPMDSNTALLRTYLKLFSDVAQPLGGAIEKGGEYIEPPEERKNFGTEVAGGVGQAGGNIILSLIPGAGPAAMFGQGVEQQKDRMDAEGVPEDERSFVALTAGGAATAATEMIEAKFLLGGLKKIPGVSNSQLLESANSLAAKLPGPLKSKWAARLASLGGAAGAEAGQEVLEGFLQDLIEYTAYNPDVDWFKDWEQEASVAGASGLITKGIVMGVTSIGRSSAHVRGDGEKKDKVSAEIQAMRAVAQQARQGQSVKRDPVKFQELMTALNQNGQEVYVTPETALALEQSGVDFTDLLRISPDIGAKLNEALATGADVAVPVDRVIGLAAQTDQYDAIFDHLRTAPDGPTLAEAQRTVTDEDAANERIRDILDEERARIDEQDLDRQGREDYEQVQERIYSQLVNTGRETAATARTQAELIGRIYETLASRTDSAPLAQRLRSRFENVETFGPRPAFRYRPDEFDVLIDQAKTRARQLQSRQTRKEGSENTNKNLFGEANKKVRKGKAAPTPVINWLAQRGGILRGSPIAKELKSMDITPANYPRLFRSKSKGGAFRQGGKDDLDAIPANEFNADFADRGVVATEDGNGYVDIAWLLEQISNESFGKGVDTYENQERQAQIDYLDQLLDILDRQGVDITSARNADIKAALGRYARENAPQALELNQTDMAAEGLRSALLDAADGLKQAKGSGEQMLGILKNTAGVKEEEIAWTGLDEFLKGKKSVTKQEIMDYLEANQVKIEEVTLEGAAAEASVNLHETKRDKTPNGLDRVIFEDENRNEYEIISAGENSWKVNNIRELRDNEYESLLDAKGAIEGFLEGEIEDDSEGQTKYESYTLPGGENYREVLLTMPAKDPKRVSARITRGFGGSDIIDDILFEIADAGLEDFDYGADDARTEINIENFSSSQIDTIKSIVAQHPDAKIYIKGVSGFDETYNSSHFNEENVLAHVRLKDRTDAEGKRVLFIEEIQSDWHQQGRKRGYKDQRRVEEIQKKLDEITLEKDRLAADRDPVTNRIRDEKAWHEASRRGELLYDEQVRAKGGVPDAPFKKTWHEMALRRVIQMAAQGGYDRVAWTTGEQQADRYDLSKKVTIDYVRQKDGKYWLHVKEVGTDRDVFERTVPERDLEDIIGKEAAQKIIDGQGDESPTETSLSIKKRGKSKGVIEKNGSWYIQFENADFGSYPSKESAERDAANIDDSVDEPLKKTLKGDDLKVGGEGMKGFYDKILPAYAKKFGKKFGAKVGATDLKIIPAEIAPFAVVLPNGKVVHTTDSRKNAEAVAKNFPGSVIEEPKIEDTPVHAIEVTDTMRAAAQRGLELFQEDGVGPRGSTVFLEDGNGNVRTLIQLFETSNRSTFLHESGHFFLDLMQDVFTDPAAPAQMKADWQATLDWFKQNGKAIHKEALGQRAFAVQHDADSGKYYTLGWDGSRVEHGTRAEAQAMADEKNTQAREALKAKSEDGDVAVAKFVDGGYKPVDPADYLLYRATHEQFARGFEAYLFKGEAPSVETRSIFETFRAWLERVYRYAIENLRVNVSPEMKGVFDRMIATDEQIEEARANMPIFRPDPSTLEMLNEQQKADYLKINERAAMSARNKLFRKAMRQHERKQTQWYKEERAKVRAEQEAILNESPLWRAVEFFKTGKGPDGTVIMESGFKLDRKAISKEFGAEVVKYLPKGVTNAKAGGLDPAVAAEMFGYKNAAEMIRAMTGLDTRKNTIERWTDEEMVKRHGDMLIDGTMEREALEALMAENPAAQAFELKALSAKTGVEYPADGDFKRAAAELLGSKKVDDAIKPEQYLRATIKARGQYAKMLERKDYDAAAVAKRQEILNRHAYKQAVEARENVQKALDHFSELARKPKKQKKLPFDADYRDKILELLSSVNLAPRISAGRRLKLELAAINEWIREKQENDSAQLMMPPELEAADGLTHYREMTLEEFIAFRDLVYNIEKQGRKKMELIVEGKRRQLAEDAEAAAEIIYKNNDVIEQPIDPQRARDQNLKERGKALVNSLVNISRKAETLIEKLDGGKTKGFIWDRLRGGIFEGELKEQVMRREASQKLNEITFKHYGKMTVELPGGRKYDAAAEDLTSTKTRVWINAHVGYMTREQIIMAVLNMGNRDNKEKLRDGRKGRDGQAWTDEDIEAIKRAVRAKDAAFINDIWEFLDSYWPQIYTLQRERLGYAPEKIEAEPFELVTADGQNVAMRGGYFRMKYDGMLSARVAETDVTGMAKELMMGTLSGTQTRRGHTHERKAGVTRPVKLHLSVINMHVNEVIHDLALGEATYNAMKFLRHPKMMEAITDTQGVEGFEALEMWLMDTAAGGLSASSDMDRLQAGMRHTLTMGSLALKYTTIAVQLTGFANTVVEIRPRWAMAGLARYMQLGGPLGAGSRVAEISEYMKQRPLLINRDVAASIRKLEKGGAWSDAQTAALAPMLRMQYVVDTVTWLGAYERAQTEGLKEKEAIRYADLAVDRAQGSSFISSLSAPERGTTGKMSRLQEANKTWTIFMSYFNAKLNVAMRRTEAFKKAGGIKNPAALASLGVDYMTLFWVEYALGELILGRVPDFEDEDDPFWSFMKWVFAGAATTAASGVIFLRDAAGVLQGFNAQPASARGLQSIGQAVGQIGREGANIISGEDEVNWYKAAKAGVTLGNFMSPVKYPSGQMNTLLEAMEDSSQGKDVSPLDYLRYNPNK